MRSSEQRLAVAPFRARVFSRQSLSLSLSPLGVIKNLGMPTGKLEGDRESFPSAHASEDLSEPPSDFAGAGSIILLQSLSKS